jgi:hypothetical protein
MNDKDYKLTVDIPIETYNKFHKFWLYCIKPDIKWSVWMSNIVNDNLLTTWRTTYLKGFDDEHR